MITVEGILQLNNPNLKPESVGGSSSVRIFNSDKTAYIEIFTHPEPELASLARIVDKKTLPGFRRQGRMAELSREVITLLQGEGIKYLDGRVPSVGILSSDGFEYTINPNNNKDGGGARSLWEKLKSARALNLPVIVTRLDMNERPGNTFSVNLFTSTLLASEQNDYPLLDRPEQFGPFWHSLIDEYHSRPTPNIDWIRKDLMLSSSEMIEAQCASPEIFNAMMKHPYYKGVL